jgi:beta-glucosidase
MPVQRSTGRAFRAVEGARSPDPGGRRGARILRRKVYYAAATSDLDRSEVWLRMWFWVAEKSMVLLENEGPLLPLDRSAIKTLAVLGQRAEAENLGDHGSSRVYPPRIVTPLQGLRDYLVGGSRVMYEPGTDLARARQAARAADAVVVIAGLDHTDEESIP